MTVSPKLALISVAALLVQFGLAILGYGSFASFFAHPVRIALVIATVALTIVALFSGGNLSAGEREDRSNRWVVIALTVLSLLIAYVPPATERGEIWLLDGDAVRWLGLVLFVAGASLRLRAVFVLGHRFSGLVAIQPGHTLVTRGLYGLIRHPSYLGLLVSTLGWVLVFRSGAGVLLVALMVPILVGRMNAEEALLQSQFGAEYEAYRARTWRLIPGLY
jgi:protein-S-isoprenylcysteine O-methyltransferase Ste14